MNQLTRRYVSTNLGLLPKPILLHCLFNCLLNRGGFVLVGFADPIINVDFKLSIITEEVQREDPDDEEETEADEEDDSDEFIPDSDDVIQSDIVTTIYGQDYDDPIKEKLYESIPSLKIILKSCTVDLTSINSHLLVTKKQVKNLSGVKVDSNNKAYSNVSS